MSEELVFAFDESELVEVPGTPQRPAERPELGLSDPWPASLGALLKQDVSRALEATSQLRGTASQAAAVASHLASLGYDAVAVRTPLPPANLAGCLRAPRHRFVSLRLGGRAAIVDPQFRDQLRIGFATPRYEAFLERHVPRVFVGGIERLSLLLLAAAEAIQEACVQRGVSVPPWRQLDALRSMWLPRSYRDDRAQPWDASSALAKACAAQQQQQQGDAPPSDSWRDTDERATIVGFHIAAPCA